MHVCVLYVHVCMCVLYVHVCMCCVCVVCARVYVLCVCILVCICVYTHVRELVCGIYNYVYVCMYVLVPIIKENLSHYHSPPIYSFKPFKL